MTQGLIGGLRAVRVRSDLERKRLHGLAARAHSGSAVGGGLYDAGSTARTYARLAEIAGAAVRNGLRRDRRRNFLAPDRARRIFADRETAQRALRDPRLRSARGSAHGAGLPLARRRAATHPKRTSRSSTISSPSRTRSAATSSARRSACRPTRRSTPRRCSPLSLAADPRLAQHATRCRFRRALQVPTLARRLH